MFVFYLMGSFMKKILLASVLLATAASSAATAAIGSFGGAYVGVLGGWARNSNSDTAKELKTMSGWAVGPQIGYGWMLAPSFYLGLDLSFLFGGPRLKKNLTGNTEHEFQQGAGEVDATYASTFKMREKFTGALMLQAGLPMGNFMPYVEVGTQVSSQEFKSDSTFREVGGNGRATLSQKSAHTSWGFAVGAGVKYSLKPVMISLGYRFGTAANKEAGETLYKVRSHKILLGLSYAF